jgi:hypothetical protein
LLRAHVEGDSGAFAVHVARHQIDCWRSLLRIMRTPMMPPTHCKTPTRAAAHGVTGDRAISEDLDRWSRMATMLIKDRWK